MGWTAGPLDFGLRRNDGGKRVELDGPAAGGAPDSGLLRNDGGKRVELDGPAAGGAPDSGLHRNGGGNRGLWAVIRGLGRNYGG